MTILRRMTHAEIAAVGTLIIEGDVEALHAIVSSATPRIKDKTNPAYDPKKHTVLQVWMATIAVKAIAKGDVFTLNALLDRVVGKVKTEIEFTPAPGKDVPLSGMNDDEVRAKYQESQRRVLDAIETTGRVLDPETDTGPTGGSGVPEGADGSGSEHPAEADL